MKAPKTQQEELFNIKQASNWLSDTYTTPKMLFDKFWFEGELCILFADTNLGKSILAMQIANSLACAQQIGPFKNEVEPCKVLYFDFEHTGSQFEARYTADDGKFSFSNTLYRAELNTAALAALDSAEDIKAAIEQAIIKTGANILVIDNLTYLQNETGKAKDALLLMQHLKALKNKYNLSILALAHTPKRLASKPLTQNDLVGSKMLINFCDSAFAIGRSRNDLDIRYLKQIKQRSTAEEYGEDNVCLFNIVKNGNFLAFSFIDYDDEFNHLRRKKFKGWGDISTVVTELSKRGLSQRRIATRLSITLTDVHILLKREEQAKSNKPAEIVHIKPPNPYYAMEEARDAALKKIAESKTNKIPAQQAPKTINTISPPHHQKSTVQIQSPASQGYRINSP